MVYHTPRTNHTVDPDAKAKDDGSRPVRYKMMAQAHVRDATFQKELLSEYKHSSKNKSQEYAKFLADKKSLITILFRQCDEATQTKIALWDTYTADRDAGILLAFIERMRTVCFGGDTGGLSYGPYKQVVAIKSLNTYTNNGPQAPHGFKEQINTKYESTKAIARKFPNRTAALMEILSKTEVPLDWAGYCALSEEDQPVWELKADALNQAMLYFMNSKNENAKKDLRLAYSQGNNTAYPTNIESAARYLSTQYPNNKPTTQREDNKGNKRKGDDPKPEKRIVTRVVLLVHKLKILQQMKTPPLLAEELV